MLNEESLAVVAYKHLWEWPRDEDIAMQSVQLKPITMDLQFTFKRILPSEARC